MRRAAELDAVRCDRSIDSELSVRRGYESFSAGGFNRAATYSR
jgi:hypothetical protein